MYDFLINCYLPLKNDLNVTAVSKKQKKLRKLIGILKATEKKSRIMIRNFGSYKRLFMPKQGLEKELRNL
jgi:hypothetical protein